LHITTGGLDDPRVVELLNTHLTRARSETAQGCAHALDHSALQAPDVTFWSAWDDTRTTVVAIGALKQLTPDHGEVKSMHVAESARGRGYGAGMLEHILAEARTRGLSRVSLETGSWPYFTAARAMYARHGFVECEPFADYVPTVNSVFMTLALR
jgi:putative acetyltransferase